MGRGDITWLHHFCRQSHVSVGLQTCQQKMLPLLPVDSTPNKQGTGTSYIQISLPLSPLKSVSYFSRIRNLPILTGRTVGVFWTRTINTSVVARWDFRSMHWKLKILFKLRTDAYVISALDSLQVEHELHMPTAKLIFNVRLTAADRAASSVAIQHRCRPLYGTQFLDETQGAYNLTL